MMAGVLRALNRKIERVFNPDRRGGRKLNRDQASRFLHEALQPVMITFGSREVHSERLRQS
jgi:hypothetical protein